MSAARAIFAVALLACAGAAFAQIRPLDRRLAPPPNKNLVPLQPTAPEQTTQPAPEPAAAPSQAPAIPPVMPPATGGSLLGSPLPPPPQVQQGAAASIKEDVSVEPGEIVVVSANMQEAQQLQQQAQGLGVGIKRRAALGSLGLVVSVLRVPMGMSVADALAQLRKALPGTWLDANHRYALEAGPELYGPQLVGWPKGAHGCPGTPALGMIDTAVDLHHPAFAGRNLTARSFLPAGVTPAAADHGTAVASLLVGDGTGLMPGAALRAAQVFRLRGEHGADTDAELVARALDWLVGQKVIAINLSFGGPRNQLVEAAIQRVEQLGVEVFAAAGNGGADAPPVYPAAQPGVVAVTAIDAKLQPYGHANRGDYIAFAAPGVDVWAAAPGGGGKYETGTSYAVPFATAVFAAARISQPAASKDALEKVLEAGAKDLGAPGKDSTFGWGLIRAAGGCGRASG
ncbi:MAG: S8 family serine peptidase [Bacteroidota bacterium]